MPFGGSRTSRRLLLAGLATLVAAPIVAYLIHARRDLPPAPFDLDGFGVELRRLKISSRLGGVPREVARRPVEDEVGSAFILRSLGVAPGATGWSTHAVKFADLGAGRVADRRVASLPEAHGEARAALTRACPPDRRPPADRVVDLCGSYACLLEWRCGKAGFQAWSRRGASGRAVVEIASWEIQP